jgi:uncharacterized protein (TIGR02099 family)
MVRRRWPHRAARAAAWVAGVAVIMLALTAGLAQVLLPLLARHPEWVAAQLSQRLHRPVSFNSMDGRWTPSGPLFVMHGVIVGLAPGEHGTPLKIPESELKLDFGGWLLPSRHLLSLHASGLQLNLMRDAEGWHVNGIAASGGGQQSFSPGRLSMDLWLEQLHVIVDDNVQNKHYALFAPQLRLSRQGTHIRFGGSVKREGVATAVSTVGRFNQDGSSGQIWFGVDAIDLKPLLAGIDMDGYTAEHGRGRLSAWLNWHNGQVSSSVIRFDLDSLSITSPAHAAASVSSLHGLAGLRHTADGYEVRWAGDDQSALVLSLHQPDTPQARVGVAAHNLQLAPLLPWLGLKPDLAPGLGQWLGSGHPHGRLDHVALQWSRSEGLRGLDVGFDDVGIDAVGSLPGLSQLHGDVRGDAEAVSLELPDQVTTLAFPHVFRQPFVLSALGGNIAAWQEDGDWHLGADALDFSGTGFAGQARGDVVLPAQGGAPFMDMYATVDHADMQAAKLFWPQSMSAGTVEWLDRALVSGDVQQGQVLVRGDMKDWPFLHNEGRFEAHAQIANLVFDYGNAWPHAEGINAVASFVGNGMQVETSAGQSLGVKVDKAVAQIPDFHDGLLDLNVQGSGSGVDLMNFVRKSPIGMRQADTLAKLNLGGTGTFQFHLSLPLKKVEDGKLDGSAELHDADLAAPAWKLQLDKLNGPLSFNLHGMQTGPLSTVFRGQPATLQLAVAGGNTDPATVLSAKLHGNYQLGELVQDYASLDWLARLGQGRSDFDIGFVIAHPAGSDAVTQTLSVDSSLSGIALDLPAPLHKLAAESLPLHLSMGLPVSGSDLQLAVGQVLRGHLRLPTDTQPATPLAGTFAFGDQMPTEVPTAKLRVRGHADQLDVTGWVQRAAAGAGGGGGPGLESIDVDTDQASMFGHAVGAMRIRATPQVDALSVDVDGKALVGNFTIPTSDMDKRGITARLQRLYWPKDPAPPPKSAATAEAVAASGSAEAPPSVTTPAADPANTGINPAALPPFHLWVADLRLGDARLGEARLETWPSATGLHIEQLRALSSRVQITASGDWNGSASNSHTHMKINFAADDLGAMLGAFGFDGLVHGGKTQDQLDASWPGSPSALSLATMDGTLSVHVADGRIPEATSPGVGRLLGLVSLAELPRRLSLDFGDVFGKGLAFDRIEGDFHLADGNATTSNLAIDGPAANVRISGRTGLRARDYDQQLLVIPHVGNSLPLVGAVVGGPIGAAAGLAVQGLLGKGLNHAASARYRITGSWDKPVMTLIEKHFATAAPAMLPAPAASSPASASPAPIGSTDLPAAAASSHR